MERVILANLLFLVLTTVTMEFLRTLYHAVQSMLMSTRSQLTTGQELSSPSLSFHTPSSSTKIFRKRRDALLLSRKLSRVKEILDLKLELLSLSQSVQLEIKLPLQVSSRKLDSLLKEKVFHLLLMRPRLVLEDQENTGLTHTGT